MGCGSSYCNAIKRELPHAEVKHKYGPPLSFSVAVNGKRAVSPGVARRRPRDARARHRRVAGHHPAQRQPDEGRQGCRDGREARETARVRATAPPPDVPPQV